MNLMPFVENTSNLIFAAMIAGIIGMGAWKRVNVFDSFVTGAKGGIETLVKIVPYLVAMLVAIGMLRASGALALLADALSPLLNKIGFPAEVLPLALIRPFSGSAANGVMAELIQNHGGDSFIGRLAATMMGSTETTFYVIAVYFGAVSIRRTRHAIPVGLLADLVGILASVLICRAVFL